MHYIKAENHEKSVTSQSSFSSAMVRCPALSQIKPHNPLLVVLLPSILLNFIIANIHSTKETLVSHTIRFNSGYRHGVTHTYK